MKYLSSTKALLVVVTCVFIGLAVWGGAVMWSRGKTETLVPEVLTNSVYKLPNGEDSEFFLRDGRVFVNGSVISADARTFRALLKHTNPGGIYFYGADNRDVYLFNWALPKADPKSWEFVGITECPSSDEYTITNELMRSFNCSFDSRDDNHLYFQDSLVGEKNTSDKSHLEIAE